MSIFHRAYPNHKTFLTGLLEGIDHFRSTPGFEFTFDSYGRIQDNILYGNPCTVLIWWATKEEWPISALAVKNRQLCMSCAERDAVYAFEHAAYLHLAHKDPRRLPFIADPLPFTLSPDNLHIVELTDLRNSL